MKYIFLTYLNRSGSTFLVNQLSKLPQICVCPEADILYELLLTKPTRIFKKEQLIKWLPLLKSDKKLGMWKLCIEDVLNSKFVGKKNYDLFIHFLNSFQKKYFPYSNYILFKHNYIYNIKIYDTFNSLNNVYWIFLKRNLRAVFLSQKLNFDPNTGKSMCKNPLMLAKISNSYVKRITSGDPNKKYFQFVEYEKLIRDLPSELDRILTIVGIIDSFATFQKSPCLHSNWIGSKYKPLHPNIDKAPILEHINDWVNKISAYDNYILKKYSINTTHDVHNVLSKINYANLLYKLCYYYFDMNIRLGIQKLQRLRFQLKYLPF